MRSYQLSGQVRRTNEPTLLGRLHIEAWDKDLLVNDFLAEAVTDEHGRFEMKIDPARFRELFVDREPDLFFKVYQGDRLIRSTEDSILWNAKSGKSEIYIDVCLPPDQEAVEPTSFQVTGRVMSATSPGVGGLRVLVVDKAVGGDVALAEAVTDDRGLYRATFTDAEVRERGKTKPDLQARVFAGEKLLAASAVHYNASAEESLNVRLDDAAKPALRSEHETLLAAIGQHFRGSLTTLEENGERQDVTYLARKTRWDARAVALAALADRFSSRSAGANGGAKIAPPLFYALLRAGLPTNEAALYQTDAATLEAAWKEALAQGVISSTWATQLPAAIQTFQKLGAKTALEAPAEVGLSSLKEMLSISLGDDAARQQQLSDLHVRYQRDLPKFWEEVRKAFGEAAERRLRMDGQLAFLTLNNAPLIKKLHAAFGERRVTHARELVDAGYYHPEKWEALIADEAIPPEVRGETASERRTRYAEFMATRVRSSFPTAAVADMVKTGETPVGAETLRQLVHRFLSENAESFQIGREPVERYVQRNGLKVSLEVVQAIKGLQRTYQITPTDHAMNVLRRRGLESSLAVSRFNREDFVRSFKDELGEAAARQVHERALQVHNAVVNLATTYLTTGNAPGIGVHSPAQIIAPHASDIIASADLEVLFGSTDFCACEQCSSVLSPAAYLVELLQFLDRDDEPWGKFLEHWEEEHGAPYPFADSASWDSFQKALPEGEEPPDTKLRPLDVLLARRPDIQHLPLTCENTHTALPYLDLVNETLEYFVAHSLSLSGYRGHTTDSEAKSEELLAAPAFVEDDAYETLSEASFPTALPFHRALETLRRYFDRSEAPLPLVMESLRRDDAVDRPVEATGGASETEAEDYTWRDILREELRLSRAEYALLTESSATLQKLYGFASTVSDADVVIELSNAKAFARRVGISYQDLVELLKTRFINPSSALIPKLEKLGVSFSTLKALKDETLTEAEFDAAIASGLDPAQFGGDIKNWVRDEANFAKIMSLITLTSVREDDLCDFGSFELRYADPDAASDPDRRTNRLHPIDFVRLIRFIRLWKKLGWTIEQTDKAITALYPLAQDSASTEAERLDAAFRTLLPRLGVLRRVIETLGLRVDTDLFHLLACFGPIDTHGSNSLYRQMFLGPGSTRSDAVDPFADDGFGNFLTGSALLLSQKERLRAAFQLTADELDQITSSLGYDDRIPLAHQPSSPELAALANYRVETISAIFRRGWLAKRLELSVRELLLLIELSGLDPFAPPDPSGLPMLRAIELVQSLRDGGLKVPAALYLLGNEDLSGESAPEEAELFGLARGLRADFAATEAELAVLDDPDGRILREKIALIYGAQARDMFFALLDNTVMLEASYAGAGAEAEKEAEERLLEGDQLLGYDSSTGLLSHTGLLDARRRDALRATVDVSAGFGDAIARLFFRGVDIKEAFFARYPELESVYIAHTSSSASDAIKRALLIATLQPELVKKRWRQHAPQRLAATTATESRFVEAILAARAGGGAAPVYPLHALEDAEAPGLDDFLQVGSTRGVLVEFFFRDTATGPVSETIKAAANLDYSSANGNPLPENPAGGVISGIWRGFLEARESGLHNLVIDVVADAKVSLQFDNKPRALTQTGTIRRSATAIELVAGVLYELVLTVEGVEKSLTIAWETPTRAREVVPQNCLYSPTILQAFTETYLRYAKTASLAASLGLTGAEIAFLAVDTDRRIADQSWLNRLPTSGKPDATTSAALCEAVRALLDFARIKADLAPSDDRLLQVLENPAAATRGDDGLLFTVTRWERASLDTLLARFELTVSDLSHITALRRVYDAYGWVKQVGVSASALVDALAMDPNGTTVSALEAAVRARYTDKDWLVLLKPINDEMRGLRRDALVAYVLEQMRSNLNTEHIDSADKLFEYFLMDVQMDPCLQTSRIRHAISSVQLFIERCLMNLEPRVAPSVLNARHWEWLHRYRVGEVIRKLFLYPENWLEPELRDDQSPCFKEMMSELLQSDITDEAAEKAYLNYLSKLDEVAKLEPCGIYYAESDLEKPAVDVHLVGRTPGAARKYFYCCHNGNGGSWTPWEQIPLDIEDDPVQPFVWRGRLLLFWLRFMQEAPVDKPTKPSGDTLATIRDQTFDAAPDGKLRAVLSWSEYFNGKWQPAKTSDLDQAVDIPGGDPSLERSTLALWISEESASGGLRIVIRSRNTLTDEPANQPAFRLHGTHRASAITTSKPIPDTEDPRRFFSTDEDAMPDTVVAVYQEANQSTERRRQLLVNRDDDTAVAPGHALEDAWSAPFLYGDPQHMFFVTTSERLVEIQQFESIVVPRGPDPLGVDRLLPDPEEMIRIPGGGVLDPPDLVTRPEVQFQLQTRNLVQFDDAVIGPAGSVANRFVPNQGANNGNPEPR